MNFLGYLKFIFLRIANKRWTLTKVLYMNHLKIFPTLLINETREKYVNNKREDRKTRRKEKRKMLNTDDHLTRVPFTDKNKVALVTVRLVQE